MGIELAKAYVRVRGDTSQLPADFNKSKSKVTSSLTDLASSSNAILGTIGVGIGASVLLGQMMQYTDLAERQIASEARLAAAVRATGMAAGFTAKQLQEQAAALQAVTTVGDEEIMELQAILVTFRKVQGDVFQRAQEATLDLATILQTDAKSAALQLGKALQDPERGVTALTRAGVGFTDQQKEQIKFLIQTNQLQRAQALILDEVEGQVAGVARAMALTDAGKLKQANNILGDMREKLGKQLIPLQTEFVNLQITLAKVLVSVTTNFGGFIAKIGKFVGILGAVAASIWIVNKAVWAFKAAQQAAAAASIFLQGTMGPAAWGKLAVGIGLATFAIGAMNTQLDAATDKAIEANAGLEGMKDTASGIAAVGVGGFGGGQNSPAEIALEKLKEDLKDVRAGLTETGASVREYTKFWEDTGATQMQLEKFVELKKEIKELQAIQEKQSRERSNFKQKQEELKDLGEELFRLRNGLTEAQFDLRRFSMTPGVTPEQVAQFKFFRDEIDKLKKAEEERDRVRDRGKSLTESLRTDAERSVASTKELIELRKKGAISEQTFQRGLAEQRRTLEGNRPERTFGTAGFSALGSQIQGALFAKQDPNKKTAEESAKTNQLLNVIIELQRRGGGGLLG